jgi:DNA replication factor GINS
MGTITISDLHGYLIDERNSGALTEIPVTLYEEVHAEAAGIIRSVKKMEDPFSEGVQNLLKERESLREYIRAIYSERMHKILFLALASANGEEISREDLRAMVPEERALFHAVAGSAQSCRKSLLDGKPDETHAFGFAVPDIPCEDAADIDAHAEDADSVPESAPVSYRVIAAREKIENFQDYSGRIHSLAPGDIVSLPAAMADILCNRNIALNIRLRK